MTPLTLRLFGSFDLQVEETPITGCSRPAQGLLTLLALRQDRSVDRAWLAVTLWPEASLDRARFYLRRSLTELRTALGPDRHRLISPTPTTLRLDLLDAECDLLAFDVLITRKDHSALEEALRLYRGPLLESCDESWILLERETRAAGVLRALENLAAYRQQRGDWGEAARLLHRAITMDPLHETGYCRLMEVLAASGDHAGVEQQYRQLRLRLHNELNTEPSSTTTALYRRLCAQSHAPQAALSAPPNDSPTRHLPCPLTALIGRTRERQEILWATSRTRLLTLTGIGGVGKTRLAIVVAEEREPAYPDGVWFVDLSSLQEPMLLPQTVARTLGVRASSGLSYQETLLQSLRSKRLLLVMDNCEHLIEGCALWVKQVLQECPEVHALCTSRQPLRIAGETTWSVDPLPVPPAENPCIDKDALAGELRDYDSVALLLDRAATVAPQFRLTPRNARAVVQICRRLDGIPLAIELAAARMRSLSVQEIAARLEDRFHLLTTGDRTLPRHQTLQAAMDWSYDLLNAPECTCLRQISVFAGGCTLEAAEAITRDGLDPLTSLVDKSLVVYEENENGRGRYRLLETVREYAQEKLREGGEWELVRLRHRDYFLSMAEAAEPHLNGPEQGFWLERLESEHDNLRIALETCLQEETAEDSNALSHSILPNPEAGLRLAGSLQRFWLIRGYLSEGGERLKAALERDRAKEWTGKRAKALNRAGVLAAMQGEYATARADCEESMAICKEIGDRSGIASSLNNLSNAAWNQGDFASARAYLEESVIIYREMEDKRGIANSLNGMGSLAAMQGDYISARAYLEECLIIYREIEDKGGIAATLSNLGGVAHYQKDYAAVRAFYEESLSLFREIGERSGIAHSLNNLGLAARMQGDYASAWVYLEQSQAICREIGNRPFLANSLVHLGTLAAAQGEYAAAWIYHEESLTICKEIGDRQGIADALEAFSSLAVNESRLERAAALWGAAEAMREEIGSPMDPNDEERHNQDVAETRHALGEKAFASAWATGRAMTMEQVVQFVQAK